MEPRDFKRLNHQFHRWFMIMARRHYSSLVLSSLACSSRRGSKRAYLIATRCLLSRERPSQSPGAADC